MDELLKNNISSTQIIYMNLEYDEFDFINDYKDLNDYIKSKIINEDKYYIFIDEIQYVKNWDKTVNSYKAKYGNNISIFITGSNSDLLSGEFAILLSGIYVSFKIYPFSFKEVCEYYNDTVLIKDNRGKISISRKS